MRYRLGSFHPRPGSNAFTKLLYSDVYRAQLTHALEEMLRVRLSRHPGAGPEEGSDDDFTDLLRVLEPGDPDYAWVHAAHDRLCRIERGGIRLRLLACEYEPGPRGLLTLAGSAPAVRLEVFPADAMQIGFAAQREGGSPVRVWPRLLREVCWNGSLVCFSELEGSVGAVGLGNAIERCLTPSEYAPAIEDLRAARATTVEDPRAWLDEMQRVRWSRGFVPPPPETVERAYLEGGDDSLYGLINAVTATARDLPDWRDRLELEEWAGHMARLRRPVPSRSGGGVLIPA
jgi:hypothetical protein